MDTNELLIGIAAFAASYYFLRYFLISRKMKESNNYQKEVLDVLNNEEYKVKGRFD